MRKSKFGLAAALITLAMNANSATSFIGGVSIFQLRTYSGGDFGNCAANISKNVNTGGSNTLTCGNTGVVSFGCDGQGPHSKTEGNTLFQSAQLAWVAGKQVDLLVTDNPVYGSGGSSVCIATTVFVKAADAL